MNSTRESPTVDARPDRCGGEVCFAGTRVPVSFLFRSFEAGTTFEEFLYDYPGVSQEQARTVLKEASTYFERKYGLAHRRPQMQDAM